MCVTHRSASLRNVNARVCNTYVSKQWHNNFQFNGVALHTHSPTQSCIRRCHRLFLSHVCVCVLRNAYFMCLFTKHIEQFEEGKNKRTEGSENELKSEREREKDLEKRREGCSISNEITHPLSLVFIQTHHNRLLPTRCNITGTHSHTTHCRCLFTHECVCVRASVRLCTLNAVKLLQIQRM